MEMSLLECLLYGLISGASEFLPISAVAHRTLYLSLIGAGDDAALRLAAHVGSLAGVIVFLLPVLRRMMRERQIALAPKKRRRRMPDFETMMEIRLWRTASIAMLLLFPALLLVGNLYERLWVLAALTAVNGLILYVPQFRPGANKMAQSLSGLDGMLIGLAAGLGVVPGISRVGAAMAAASLRGTDRGYRAELAQLLSIPALVILIGLDGFSLAGSGAVAGFLPCFLVALGAFGAGWCASFFMRFLSVKVGYGGFAYYCWGAALFTLIIYLI